MNLTIHPQNTLKKSDKKFVRLEKARIRSRFLDFKKQEEMITELYQRFLKQPKVKVEKVEEKPQEKKEVKKPEAKKATAVGGVPSEGGKEVKKVKTKK